MEKRLFNCPVCGDILSINGDGFICPVCDSEFGEDDVIFLMPPVIDNDDDVVVFGDC